MSIAFHTTRCDNLDEFVREVRPLLESSDKWVFRGHKKADWCLTTTLERACEQFGVEGDERAKIEGCMIREFQRRLHHYTAHVPDEGQLDEWMALMQHHGAPTRLLDFTYSPYVAAYFAFEAAKSNSTVAIWAVNRDWCKKELKRRFSDLFTSYEKYGQDRRQEAFKTIFMNDSPKKLVLGVNPYRLNERLAYQRGSFLCPGDVTVGFMDNLSAFTGESSLEDKIVQFTIPTGGKGETRDEELQRLDQMNISRITLFPGLDGFAQSFAPRIPSLFRTQRWSGM